MVWVIWVTILVAIGVSVGVTWVTRVVGVIVRMVAWMAIRMAVLVTILKVVRGHLVLLHNGGMVLHVGSALHVRRLHVRSVLLHAGSIVLHVLLDALLNILLHLGMLSVLRMRMLHDGAVAHGIHPIVLDPVMLHLLDLLLSMLSRDGLLRHEVRVEGIVGGRILRRLLKTLGILIRSGISMLLLRRTQALEHVLGRQELLWNLTLLDSLSLRSLRGSLWEAQRHGDDGGCGWNNDGEGVFVATG